MCLFLKLCQKHSTACTVSDPRKHFLGDFSDRAKMEVNKTLQPTKLILDKGVGV